MMTYRLLPHLPVPPAHILQQVDFSIVNPAASDYGLYRRRSLKGWYGRDFDAAMNARIRFTENFEHWVKQNITDRYNDVGVNYVDSDESRNSTGAHCDLSRRYAVIFNVLTGGPHATLCFWQEKGQALIREPGCQCSDFDRLTLVDSVQGPKDCWYIIDAHVLHGVEHLTGPRINLQISLDYELT